MKEIQVKKLRKCYSLLHVRYEMSEKRKKNYKCSCQSVYSFLKTDYIQLITSYEDGSACLWKQLKWNKFPFYGDRMSAKLFSRGLTSKTTCLRKSLKMNKVAWWGDRLPGEVTPNKRLKNKIVLQLAPSPRKKKHLSYMEIVVASANKGKVVHVKQVWIG